MLRQPPSPTGICVLERDIRVSRSQFLSHYSFVGRRPEPTQKETHGENSAQPGGKLGSLVVWCFMDSTLQLPAR